MYTSKLGPIYSYCPKHILTVVSMPGWMPGTVSPFPHPSWVSCYKENNSQIGSPVVTQAEGEQAMCHCLKIFPDLCKASFWDDSIPGTWMYVWVWGGKQERGRQGKKKWSPLTTLTVWRIIGQNHRRKDAGLEGTSEANWLNPLTLQMRKQVQKDEIK